MASRTHSTNYLEFVTCSLQVSLTLETQNCLLNNVLLITCVQEGLPSL